ncbi:MAG: FAD-binding oxidoreductase [Nocardioidaceae bacterium]|nr:FAD-binding oxidoreductase [Nocardioidaceae bacterium]
MTLTENTTDDAVVALAAECAGVVHLPGTPAYDQGRFAWNVAVNQRPAAVALPETVEQLRGVVRHAARLGLRVSAQSTGHAAAILAQHRLDDVVLVRTGALRGVHVDPVSRVARVEAGACWQDVVDVASSYGLAALHGSAPDVGVVGYCLGGGLSWYARKHGLAANSVVGIELVGADGDVVRADAETRPELFWALRGGGGNFGVVTTIEVALQPIADAYAGMMLWPLERAPEVLRAFAAFSPTAPEEVTASFRILRFPPIPELPDFLRGRSVVVLDGAVLLDDAAATDVLSPFRALRPEMDTFARVPSSTLTTLHMDPPEPTPGVGAGVVLDRLDEEAVAAFLAEVGPEARTGVFIAELRMLGGALARSAPGGGALDRVAGSHVAFFLCVAPTPEAAAAGHTAIDQVLAALTPWEAEQRLFLNFADRPVEVSEAFGAASWGRLVAVKRDVDPGGVFLGNHAI